MEKNFKEKIEELISELNTKNYEDAKVVIGLDGFVDNIMHVVDKRINAEEFIKIKTIKDYGERVVKAAGLSANFEMVVEQQKLGGNGPILSNALATYGVGLTYIGSLGFPHIEKVFEPMVEKATVLSIANAGHTDALEFEDGKLMIGKHSSLKDVNWGNIKKIIGVPKLIELINDSKLLGLENWTMLPYMSCIFKGMIEEVLPHIDNTKGKRLAFFDLADPEKRTKEDIIEALELIKSFGSHFKVILGLNFKEGIEIAEVLGLKVEKNAEDKVDLEKLVTSVGEELNLYSLVIHPTIEAATYIGNKYYHAVGPYTPKPKLTTGAGDNFNAGFCFGQILGLNPEQSVTLGVATSGFYVRNAKSPTFAEIKDFLKMWSNDQI